MLLKILVYGYLTNVFSSRKLEEATKQNTHFMWLAAMTKPDHNTINRFRSGRLKDELKEIFTQVVLLLEKEGLVSLKTTFVDGTKIEANANRYTFVWGKAIKKSKERIQKQLEELWNYTQQVACEELKNTVPVEFKAITKEEVTKTIEAIDSALKKKKIPSKVRQKINYAKKNWPANLEKYGEYEKVLEQRNSFSKTDTDATFMRMKEDHMLNGQLKPGYNLQISTNEQFILHYSIHSNPTDTRTLQPHLNSFKEQYNRNPKEVVADAGYGSEENYLMFEKENITPYVKYNYFDREQKEKKKKNNEPVYDGELDCYFCPKGKPLFECGQGKRKNRSGYIQTITTYKATNCSGCPLVDVCKVKTYRKNQKLAKLYTHVRNLLNTERGIKLRKKRACDVETVFAQIKNNKGFRRFYLRGKNKVEIEIGLLALAHNLKKWAA